MTEFIRNLAQYDTPTISNTIEVAQGGRGYDRFTRRTLVHTMNGVKAMMGSARPAKISGVKPPTRSVDIIKARRLDYFKYMAAGAEPIV